MQDEEHLSKYAIYLGTAFQIVDDILDYTGNASKMGKNIGDDLLEGKVTLPLIYILTHGSINDKTIIQNAINDPENCNVDEILNIINASNAIEYCTKKAEEFSNKAKHELSTFKENTYKDCLVKLTDIAINRVS